MNEVVYSPVTGAAKATKNTFVQIIIWALGLMIANWDLILSLLPQWKEMTVGAAIAWCLNFIYNWIKNKNPN